MNSQDQVLRAIAVDDEPLALELLESLLSEIDGVELVALCRCAEEAIEFVQDQIIDLVFLDIEMPEINGFEFVKRIQPEIFPHIIFTTAFSQYAVDAFRIHAVDYLLKPLDEDRLRSAVHRAQRAARSVRYDGVFKLQVLDALKHIIQRMSGSNGETGDREHDDGGASAAPKAALQVRPLGLSLAVRERGRTIFILAHEITWLEAAGDYVVIHTKDNSYSLRSTLKEIEGRLDSAMFARIHRSTIVNKAFIQEIRPLPKGEALLILPERVKLKASRNFRANIRDLG
jgi:two-component system, LytTR family, response regulator